jgi:hypothetical protein
MRPLFVIGGVIAAHLFAAGSLDAGVIKGRVLDSAGRPIAGAEIRFWRRARPTGGTPVKFDDKEALLADGKGHFETPNIFDVNTPVRVTAQAVGMLAGRSGWFRPQQEFTEVDDIVLAQLRSVPGRVVDSQGAPVAGATVFNGDGHQRVEAKTGSTGKFLLEDVPEKALFLFAEKPGYRLSGSVLGADKDTELRMARSDEPIEPLKSRDPVLATDERIALGHRLLAPYLEAVSHQGNDTDKNFALHELSMIDPPAALEWVDRIGFAGPAQRENCREIVIANWMTYKDTPDWERIRAVLDSSKDDGRAARSLIIGAQYKTLGPDRQREWLDQGLMRSRAVQDAAGKAVLLAWAAQGSWRLGDRERATTLAREAEAEADNVSRDLPTPEGMVTHLARATAPIDLPRALQWLDQVKGDFQFSQAGAFVALLLAPIDVAKAEEAWNHIGDRGAKDRAFMKGRDLHAAEFCFRVAQIDPDRAERIAAAVESPFWRVQARAAVARAVGGQTAKKRLLRDAVADTSLDSS